MNTSIPAGTTLAAIDVDSHEMVPFHMWADTFGAEVTRHFAPFAESRRFLDNGANTIVRPDILADDAPITPDAVWQAKGPDAPGAIDMDRRPEVLDAMGVERALVFPSFGLIGIRLASSPELAATAFMLDLSPADAYDIGRNAMRAFNDWAVDQQRRVGERVRPVAVMLTEDVGQMTDELTGLIGQGIRAVWIPNSTPPGGTSPADPALDRFWRTAADADCTVLLHVGTDFSFPASDRWAANVPCLVTPNAASEFPVGPFTGATVNFASENFLAALVLGGVFERVPNLRFGAIEVGAGWLGPLAERLDMWAGEFRRRLSGVLSMRPSEYLARNVRVTPYAFEPVDRYFERYPAVANCLCFSTDYPRVEGGVEVRAAQERRLARLGPDVTEKFFRTNGEWLVPA
jgi:predicted TIM-barrel fold metal-dependent hydrolase